MCGSVLYICLTPQTQPSHPPHSHIFPPSFYLFVKEMCCYKRIKLYDDTQRKVSSSTDCHLEIAEETRNDAEILGCGEERKFQKETKDCSGGGSN